MPIRDGQPRIEGNFEKITEIVFPIGRGGSIKGGSQITRLFDNEEFARHIVLKSKLDAEQIKLVSDLFSCVDFVLKGKNETTISDLRAVLIADAQKLQDDLKTDPQPIKFLLKLFINDPSALNLSKGLR